MKEILLFKYTNEYRINACINRRRVLVELYSELKLAEITQTLII